MKKQEKRRGTPEAEKGANHWLLQQGYALNLDNPALILCKVECESWLELMRVSDIDAALGEIDTIAAHFDEQLGAVKYVAATGFYWADILSATYGAYSSKQKNPEYFPKAKDIPLSVKIAAMQQRGLSDGILLNRQHLLAAAYRCIVHDYYMWNTVMHELEKGALNSDEQGYHISVMYDPHKVFALMCEVSALLALASNADIVKSGVMRIGDILDYGKSSQATINKKKAEEKSIKTKFKKEIAYPLWNKWQKEPEKYFGTKKGAQAAYIRAVQDKYDEMIEKNTTESISERNLTLTENAIKTWINRFKLGEI